MCGSSLNGEEEADSAQEDERETASWIGSALAVLLALAILSGGAYGLYAMLIHRPAAQATRETATPTVTPTKRPTSTPTETPIPTATATPIPPRAHDVQPGETLSDIAEVYRVSVDDILDLNPELDPELIRAGQVVLVPPGQAANQVSGSGQVEGDFVIHVVDAGESLSSIAADYEVSVAALRSANDISDEDETIREGQSLVVPLGTPTPAPAQTHFSQAPTAAPTYPPPPLLSPQDGAAVTDAGPVLLQWASVRVLQDNEWYLLHLWQESGDVVSTTVRTRTTAWRVPADLLQSGEPTVGEFRWQIQVVRETGEEQHEAAGDPSATYTFSWRGSIPTGTPQTAATP